MVWHCLGLMCWRRCEKEKNIRAQRDSDSRPLDLTLHDKSFTYFEGAMHIHSSALPG